MKIMMRKTSRVCVDSFGSNRFFSCSPLHENGKTVENADAFTACMSLTALKPRTNLNKISNVKSVTHTENKHSRIRAPFNVFVSFYFLAMTLTCSPPSDIAFHTLLAQHHAKIFNKYFPQFAVFAAFFFLLALQKV